MSIFAKPSTAPVAKTISSRVGSLLYAGILTIMAVAQLFTFEDFLPLFQVVGEVIGSTNFFIVGTSLVVLEIFSLPFLLRMHISPAFRWFSLLASILLPVVWLGVSIIMIYTNAPVPTVGYFGTVFMSEPAIWAVSYSLGLFVLSLWAAWGLQPRTTR